MTGFFMSDMNPIYVLRRKGDINDPFVSITETIKVGTTGKVILKEIPSKFHRVVSSPLFEKQTDVNLGIDEFYVDYSLGIVTLAESKISSNITFTYQGTGVISIGASRIYVEADGSNPIKSLEDLIEELGAGGGGGSGTYTHPLGDGYLHVPVTSTTNNGKVLKAGNTAGSISWSNISITEISNLVITTPILDHVITYNGTNWINSPLKTASTTVAGIIQLTSATNSTSTTLGANALAVKTAWDLANSKAPTTVVNTTTNGLMIASDKVKLDTLSVHPANHPPSIITQDTNNRFVTDAEKATWNAKASTAVVTTTVNGLMIASDKVKLDTLSVHPANHPPSIITQDASNRFVTDTEKNTWNAKASTAVVTTTVNGLMIASDKVKLDGLSNYTHPTTHPPSIITQDSNNRFVTDLQISAWDSGTGGGGGYVHPTYHPPSIILQDASNRFVTDAEKVTWNAKASTAIVNTTTNGLMIATDKVKLDGLSNYSHPANHPPSIITQDASNRFVTDAEKVTWNAKASTAIVTTGANGLMIATDKVKLDGLSNYSHPANHPPSIITQDASNRFVTDAEKVTWNAKATTAIVNTTTNGLMIATDKVKLDGLSNYTHPTNHPPSIITQDANNRFMTDAERTKLATVKTMTTGTANPTGGADGDIYFQYE